MMLRIWLLTITLGFAPLALWCQSIVPGELIVQLQPQASISEFTRIEGSFHASGIQAQLLSLDARIYRLHFNEEHFSAHQLLSELREHPSVAVAQYNHRLQYRKAPNDPEYANQWTLHNTGITGGSPGADIDAERAWNLSTGGVTSTGDTIVVAVIDGGYDIFHEDLDPNLYRNRDEIPNNGIDDDNNGKIDDYRGWDFPFQSDTPFVDFHGTAVASIIGAKGNNGKGVTGVNWDVKIMPVAMGQITEAATIEAMDYVWTFRKRYNASQGQKGAFVVAINTSFGLDFVQPDSMPIWCGFYDSLGAAGILSVASTMNRNANVDSVGDMPTSCGSDYLIAVTNTNELDQKVGLAAYGPQSIDLGAPGEDSYVALPNNQYNTFDGTSAAAPHVAGAVALLYSASCDDIMLMAQSDPATLALDMKQAILYGTEVLPSLADITVSGGRLNLYNSLLLAENYGNCELASIGQGGQGAGGPQQGILGLYPNPATTQVTVQYRNLEVGNNRFILLNALGQTIQVWEDALQAPGVHTLTLPLPQLPGGIYFIRFDQGSRQSPLHTLVIQ